MFENSLFKNYEAEADDYILFFNFFRAHMNSLLRFIETGVKEGAKLVYGGKRLDRKGKFHNFLPLKF